MPAPGPIFLAGTDRSGIGILGEVLTAHPNIFISRRTRFWSFYYERFGDLGQQSNLERAVDTMLQYTRITDLAPNRTRILAEFAADPSRTGYGALFELLHRHHLEQVGKTRWGDKTINAERHAPLIFREFPTAVMIHVVRDPRDRYASQAGHRNASRGKVGAGTALWLSSVRWAERNRSAHPGRYEIVRYEDLVSRPAEVIPKLCDVIGEPFDERMLSIQSVPQNGRSPLQADERAELVPTSIGRFRNDLSRQELAFIQLVASRPMRRLGYEPAPVAMAFLERARFTSSTVPRNLLRMGAWWVNMRWRERRAGAPSERRMVAPD